MRNKFVGILLLTFVLQGCAPRTDHLCIGQACFCVETVRTDEAREKGLMFRKGLAEGRGMLFVFEKEDIYPFWMKNMQFPIDIIWISQDKRVVHIESNVPPCKAEPCAVYRPSAKASYVLEIFAGDAAKSGIRLADPARF